MPRRREEESRTLRAVYDDCLNNARGPFHEPPNFERAGMTGSERQVGEAFQQLIPLRKGRILVATFGSQIHRMQQAADVAIQSGRKVAIVGRSMRKNMNIARNLGYVEIPASGITTR